ncbi:MAG: endonuclease I family protein [Bacteroidales bacterium]
MKRFIALNLNLYLFVAVLFAVAPAGYYNSLEGKKAAALKTELNRIICKDTTHYLGYGSGKGKTWEGFNYTDQDPVTHAVIDMYSANVRYFPYPNPTFVSFGQTIHIEHSMPKSWWGCDIAHADVAACDLHHLYPADGPTNSSKNDNPLGVVTGTASLSNGVSKVGQAVYDGYVGAVFEPANQYKGDFARSYLYMAAAYEHYVNRWDITKPENMMEKNTYPTFKPWAIKLLLEWHKNDPVSQKELTRTEVVYGIQTNRNPFIDHPELADYIWGDKTMIPYRLDGRTDFPYLSTPTTDDVVDFGKAYLMQTSTSSLNLKAMNLTGNLTLTLSGTDAAYFSIDRSSLTKAEAEAGLNVGVTFNSTKVGSQTAKVTITGGGIDPVVVNLKATISSSFVALSATNITQNSFTANWTESTGATGYILDVYSQQSTGAFTPTTLLEEEFIGLLGNSWTKTGYTDNTLYSNIRLGSQTLAGALTLPPLNLTTIGAKLTVKAKQYSSDNGAVLTATLNGQPLAAWATDVNSQSFTAIVPKGGAANAVILSAEANKRVYVDYVKVSTYQPAQINVSLAGYPVTLTSALSYTVSGLQSGTPYYYSVLPIGGSAQVSNQVVIHNFETGLNVESNQSLTWKVSENGVDVYHLPAGCELTVLNTIGKQIATLHPQVSFVRISLPQRGVYILQVKVNKRLVRQKVMY